MLEKLCNASFRRTWVSFQVSLKISTVKRVVSLCVLDEKYLVITAKPHIVMEEAEKFGFTDTSSQWLFFILKNSTSKHGTLPIMRFVKEGGNIAVAINSTTSNSQCMVCISVASQVN